MSFSGAKLALFLGPDLVVIRRDDRPDIPYPGHWDFPGGGREGDESPQDCALRETREEIGLILKQDDLTWSNSYLRPRGVAWMFAAHFPRELSQDIEFGSEGQGWRLMAPEQYCENDLAVPHFVEQLRLYMTHDQYSVSLGKTPRC